MKYDFLRNFVNDAAVRRAKKAKRQSRIRAEKRARRRGEK